VSASTIARCSSSCHAHKSFCRRYTETALTDLRARVQVIRDGSSALPPVIADAACDVAVTTSDTLEWQTSPAVSGVGTIVRTEGGGKAFKILDTASSSVNVGVLLRELGLAAPSRCRLHLDWIRRSEQATAAEFTIDVKVVAGRCIPLCCIRRCCGGLLSGPFCPCLLRPRMSLVPDE
jgi:hypothetical protein